MAVPDFLGRLGARGDATALVTAEGRRIGYAELARRGAEFAARLGGERRLVAIEMQPSEHAVAAFVGALAAGHAVAALPPEAGVRDAFRARFAPEAVWRPVEGRWRLETAAAAGPLHPDLALLLLTSGSTGVPRAVRLSGAAVGANAAAIGTYLGLAPGERAGLVLPLHYTYGLSVLTSHLAAGASVWLSGASILDPGFLDRLAARGCTSLAGVPHSFELLERVGFRGAALPALRTLTVAGGRLGPERVRLYAAHMRARGGRLFVMYGQTEATARIAWLPPERAADRPDRIGVAIPGGRLSLVDEGGREIAGAGVAGEIVYRGPNVMMGYGEGRADLARGAEVEVLCTGDLGERDADGLYRIVGRKSRFSKIAGLRIGHDALEAGLAERGIAAAVTGDDERLVAAVEAVEPAAVRAELGRLTGLPLQRIEVRGVARLPRHASGKLDYGAVRAPAVAAPPVSDGVEEEFRAAFFPLAVGPRDSFVRLGGDSLRRVDLALALERRLGRLPRGWEEMEIADLTRAGGGGRAQIGIDLVIRALAILMVVVQHATLWPVPVGSAAMVVLIGFGLARFQRQTLAEGGLGRFLRPLGMALLPYYAIVAAYALAWGQVPWASVFLVGNFGIADPVRHGMLPFLYWFVEIYAQLLLGLAALFLFAPARRLAVGAPFRFGLAFLAAALVARAVGPALWPIGGREIFTLPWVLPLAAFGWCAGAARTWREKLLVLGLAALVMPALALAGGNWVGAWVRYLTQGAVIGALVLVPGVALPGWLARPVLAVAAAGYHIYLFHRFAPELLLAPLEGRMGAAAFAVLAVGSGVLVGLAAWRGQRALMRLRPGVEARLRGGLGSGLGGAAWRRVAGTDA